VHDITERKLAEGRITDLLSFNEKILNIAPVGILTYKVTGECVFANEIVARIVGTTVEKLTAQNFRTLDSWKKSGLFQLAERAIASAEPEIADIHHTSTFGKDKWLTASAVTFRSKAETRLLLTLSDITERKQAEEELQRTLDELKHSNAELEEFAYVASHDLQEPLRGIAGLTQLLQRRYQGQLDSRADEYIDHIVDGTQRMQTLINDLLAYSRVGRRGEAIQSTEAETALKAALKNLNAAILEDGAAITSDRLPKVKADPTQLTQLFQNLIGNAIKFRSEQPPQIHIHAVEAGDCWQFSVRDNGIGIAPEYHERIFQVFQRLHTRRAYNGTGIGLAICKKIIERHGGKIWVESGEGQGSTFYFTLPKG
jgi:PAS domain S-box-containing protein